MGQVLQERRPALRRHNPGSPAPETPDRGKVAGARLSPPRASDKLGRAMLAFVPSRIAVPLSAGALLGLLAWSFGGPTVVSWWYEPPVKDALSCAPSVRQAVTDFVKWGLGVAAVSAVVTLTLVSLVRRRFGGAAPAPAERG